MRANGPDTIHIGPTLGPGGKELFDGAEPIDQCARRVVGDSRNASQRRDARRWPKPPFCRARARSASLLSDREPVKPKRGVIGIAGADDGDAEVCDRKQATANRIRVAWSSVEIVTFDEEKWQHADVAHPTDLRPESSARERAVKIGHGLALDQHTAVDAVIASRQGLDHDLRSELLQARRNTASVLEHIRSDNNLGSTAHLCSLLRQQDGSRETASSSRCVWILRLGRWPPGCVSRSPCTGRESSRRRTITIMTTTTSTRTRPPAAHTGRLRLVVERRGERSAVVRAEGHIPYAARLAPARPGWARVVLIQTIAGPLAGDRATIEVEVGEGAALELVTNAATVALPCSSTARHQLRFELAEDARLAWLPQPLILAAGCDLEASVDLRLDQNAAALTRELVVLGRHGEQPGRYRSSLRCELGGCPLLHDAVEIDPNGLAVGSAAILDGARACASLALLGLEPDHPADPEELALARPGRVLRALARDTASLRERLAAPEAAYLNALASPVGLAAPA